MGDHDNEAGPLERWNICFVSRAIPAHRFGGLEFHLRDLSVALKRRGHNVTIITTVCDDAAASDSEMNGIDIRVIPGARSGDYSVTFFRRVHSAVRATHDEKDFDIICPIDLAGLFMRPAEFSALVMPIIHGTMTSETPLHWRYWKHLNLAEKAAAAWRYKTRLALLGAFRRMVLRSEALLVDSEFTRRELILECVGARSSQSTVEAGERAAEMARKINVALLGIDPSRYSHAETASARKSDDVFRIVLLGRFQKMKGIGQAIQAASALKARGINFQMTIGGGGDFVDEAREMIRDSRLQDQVHIAGRIPAENLGEFFAGQDVFLFPDMTLPAFGLVAVEAMLYGLPVVAADSGAVPEVASPDCGWLYDPWDRDELAGLLARLPGRPDEVRHKAENAKNRFREFTSGNMAIRTELAFVKAWKDSRG